MNRLRIVIDTNVLISALLKPSGLEAQLFELIAYRVFDLFVTAEVVAEYRGVLGRPKFTHIASERISRLLALFADEATLVAPSMRLNVSEHEDDNRFYECADAAQADYIVTGNAKHFTKPYQRTRIVNTRQLLDLLMQTNK